MQRAVELSIPFNTTQKTGTFKIEGSNPYQVVENLRGLWRTKLEDKHGHFAGYKIDEIIPIHNLSGIKIFGQVEKMRQGIRKYRHIKEADQLPNIKLVVAEENKLLLFDGHHSLLAYFLEGRKFLREVPYLVVSKPDYQPVSTEEIAMFFPAAKRGLVKENWRKYTVNWQSSVNNQLEQRGVNNFKELADRFRKRDESSSQH